ncbi:MAG: bifunctional riboflavin kinase/FAD synthetase [Candidatus Fonsibacter lacus]|jgi:riboflavin kinase/FMN adenylyltransferase|nr:bifunctional riboflavin kinase/FAD synthetase [Candidatus Fonsibacter lacus]
MKIYSNINSVDKKFINSVLAIGNFDGVHLGHQELLKKAYIFSRKINKKFGIFTFDPLPKDFFNRTDNKILNINDKIDVVKKFRADFFIKQNFNRNFSKISHDNFAKIILLKKLAVHSIFVGKDFKFGFKRKGNIFFLKKLSENNNFKIFIINFKKFNNYKISSSKIRSLIQAGKVNLAHKIMGRPWSISGKVIQGKKYGRRIGFPTANIKIFNQIKPLFGVYSVKIVFNKKTYKGIANFGVRPTFGSSSPVLEVNVFGKNHNFYNKNIKVLFIDFIRKEKKFKNSSMLVRQIKKDIKVAKISLNKK